MKRNRNEYDMQESYVGKNGINNGYTEFCLWLTKIGVVSESQ